MSLIFYLLVIKVWENHAWLHNHHENEWIFVNCVAYLLRKYFGTDPQFLRVRRSLLAMSIHPTK